MPCPGPAIPGRGGQSGSACSGPGPACCARSPTRARPLRRRERPAPSTRPAADCTSSARSATSRAAPRPARRKGRVGPVLPAAPVPEQTRPRPVAEPRGRAEPASVNDPSPAVCRTDIGHWPVTSSTGHVWITIWCRYGRDRLADLPAGHQAARICAGKWRTGRPGADPGTPPGVAPPSWVLAQFIHKLVHSPLHSRPHQGWRDRSAAVHAGPGSREGFSCRPAVPRLAPVPSARDQPCAVQGKATMQERAIELRHEPGG